ncbi:MAG: hypothetical protein DWI03_00075 [Planctomycetota bacterium]|nr:MAG: hypothetical protein DWI03_00075 [Planctomycetota bacterium]
MDEVTDLDRRQAERVAQLKRASVEHAAAEGQGATDTAPAADATAQPAARKGDRWITFNTFMDVIAPRLTLAERAVWLVMFRHARDGKCETTVRMLANGAAVSRSTAEIVLRRLEASGLVWAIWKSRDKGKPSKYGIHAHPDRCLHRLPTKVEPS